VFRALRKFAGRYRERVLSLVMLPAFLLNTIPQTVCICADGHRELFCPAVTSGASECKATCCNCSCCPNSKSSEQKSCCRGGHHSTADSGWTSLKRQCCRLVSEAPAPLVKANQDSLPTSHDLVAIASPDVLIPATSHYAARSLLLGNRPPPLDLPIVYLHLTI